MKKIALLLVLIIPFACTRYPAGVEETLSLAGSNRGELEKVLRHYREAPADSLKYKAACFLIDNMKWHLSTEQAIFPDSSIYKWHTRIDSLYKYATGNIRDTMLNSRYYEERNYYFQIAIKKLINAMPVDTPTIKKGTFPDPKYISSAFLVSHIENAFQAWQTSPHASYLTFEQFKELILPYRAIAGYPFFENGKRLNDMFKGWLDRSTMKDILGFILRYNHYTRFIRSSLAINQWQHVGVYDLFLGYKGDCICMANNACNIFRAYGIPVVVDHNVSFREKTNRHFHCKFIDSTTNQNFYNKTFNFDTLSPYSSASPSFFRNTFGAQTNSPYMLKAEGEYLPDYFDTPCLKEVTGEYYRVTRVSLPFDKDTPNHLAFLYTFDNTPTGTAPATWGKIDKARKQVVFENVVYHTLYFPSYFRGDTLVSFASPFYIAPADSLSGSYQIVEIVPEHSTRKDTLVLLRKFPEKPYLKEQAKRMIGGRFEGANHEDFSDSTLLYTIREAPILNFQEYTPEICRPFRFYRYVAPGEFSRSNMSIIEFLTDEYTPEDSLKRATPLPVFSPEVARKQKGQETYMKLHPDIAKYPNQRWGPLYNTSMQYPSYESTNEMSLKRPMKVKKIRVAPCNAENHIVIGHRYQLLYWDNEWKNVGTKIARHNYLLFNNVPSDRLYWLRDLTTGKEELPFLYHDNKQLFIYHDTIIPLKTNLLY
ncbi:hypothetical protein AALK14_13110 [Butyricimonas hominis]|uniref:hypothetical protein n=1 Tax=Butyricimonas hominis TaxID=2763032 RepID=UPI003516E5C2